MTSAMVIHGTNVDFADVDGVRFEEFLVMELMENKGGPHSQDVTGNWEHINPIINNSLRI